MSTSIPMHHPDKWPNVLHIMKRALNSYKKTYCYHITLKDGRRMTYKTIHSSRADQVHKDVWDHHRLIAVNVVAFARPVTPPREIIIP